MQASNDSIVLLVAASAVAEHLFLDSLRHVEKVAYVLNLRVDIGFTYFGNNPQDGVQSQVQCLNGAAITKQKGLSRGPRGEKIRVDGKRKENLQGL